MKLSKRSNKVRSIALAAIFLAILVAQEQLLIAVPNVQLTVALIIFCAYLFPLEILIPQISAYVIIDSMINGSLNLIYFPGMLLAWLFLAVIARYIRNKPDYVMVIFGVLFGFIYGWFYIPAQMVMQGIGIFWPYLKADLLFEVIMAVNNLITIIFVYFPLKKIFENYFSETLPFGK